MKRLYIVRHGQTVWNVERKYAGEAETPLTEQGQADAHAAGVAAKALNIDYIISSPLSRAYNTASIIAQEINFPVDEIVLDELLIERAYGPFVGKSWDIEIDGRPGVETVDSVIERAKAVLEQVKQIDAQTILLVSHGTFAKAMRHVVNPEYNVSYNDISTELKNGEIFQLI